MNYFDRNDQSKPQDECRPTVNELANQKFVLQKINGWKIYHLSAGMEDIVDMENELSDKLEDFAQRIEDAASKITTFSIIFLIIFFLQIKMLTKSS